MRSNKDSFNFLEPLNGQPLSICYFPLTTSQTLNLSIFLYFNNNKKKMFEYSGLPKPHKQFKKSVGSVVCGECCLESCLVISEITVVQSLKERSPTDMRNGRCVGQWKELRVVRPGLILSSQSYLGNKRTCFILRAKKKPSQKTKTIECVFVCLSK